MNRFVAVAMLVVALVAGALAQPRNGAYRLQPDDVIRIQVFNQQQLSADVPIGHDGAFSAPFVGIVEAAGKTTIEIERELEDLYQKRLKLREPIVSVSVLRYRPLRASVGGYVNRPGTYEMRHGDTIVTLLTQGGGAVPERADLRRTMLRRRDTVELIPIDLQAMLLRGDMSQNYTLQDGDELIVPEETRNRITIMGMVQRPGFYPYREPMFLNEAIAMAGGDVPTRSRMSRITILRERPGQPGEYVRIQSNFVRFYHQNDQLQNVELRPGDMVYVPETDTPDFARISQIANTAFILDRAGSIFGLRIFR
jgi:polysaccharide biosynthesis/export protein